MRVVFEIEYSPCLEVYSFPAQWSIIFMSESSHFFLSIYPKEVWLELFKRPWVSKCSGFLMSHFSLIHVDIFISTFQKLLQKPFKRVYKELGVNWQFNFIKFLDPLVQLKCDCWSWNVHVYLILLHMHF